MKKRVLVVSSCSTRGNTGGLTEQFVTTLLLNESLIDVSLLDISFLKNHDSNRYKAHHYYKMPSHLWIKTFMRVPYLRRWFIKRSVCHELKYHLLQERYDIVVVFEIPWYADSLVRIVHGSDTKVMLYPWGSDVLRASGRKKNHHAIAFKNTDFVCGYYGSAVINHIMNDYNVEKQKVFTFNLSLPGIIAINNISGKMSRHEMAKAIDIPYSNFNIVCGYNGQKGQRHSTIIENIAKVKQFLPQDYLLIFPITYGNGEDYYNTIKEKVATNNLHAIFLEKYLSDKQIACLHLITDLYINIQPSDNGNGFLIESLYAKNSIICGGWLKYEQFEKYGIPYYQCYTPDSLDKTILTALTERKTKVPEELVREISKYTPEDIARQWADFFTAL